MAVLAHEGTHTVIFRSVPIPIGATLRDGYLARPDLTETSPTVVVLHGIGGLDSATKQLCRTFARHGFVAVAPDWYTGAGPTSADDAFAAYAATTDGAVLGVIDETVEYLASEYVPEADASAPIVVGTDLGGRFALLYGAHNRSVAAVASLYAPLRGDEGRGRQVVDAIPVLGAPVLGLYGEDDELIDASDVDAAQAATPNGQWILYEGVGHGFLDADADGYDAGAEADAIARLIRMASAAVGA